MESFLGRNQKNLREISIKNYFRATFVHVSVNELNFLHLTVDSTIKNAIFFKLSLSQNCKVSFYSITGKAKTDSSVVAATWSFHDSIKRLLLLLVKIFLRKQRRSLLAPAPGWLRNWTLLQWRWKFQLCKSSLYKVLHYKCPWQVHEFNLRRHVSAEIISDDSG